MNGEHSYRRASVNEESSKESKNEGVQACQCKRNVVMSQVQIHYSIKVRT